MQWNVNTPLMGRPRHAARAWTRQSYIVACVVALLAVYFSGFFDGPDSSAARDAPGHTDVPVRILLGPVQVRGGYVQLEKHAGYRVDRFRIVSHTLWTDKEDLDTMLDMMAQAFARKKPFLIIWDVRKMGFPRVRREQIRQVHDFLDDHLIAWDTYVQAHAVILTNPLVRAFAALLKRLFEPPQPVTISRDDAGADEFARRCCDKPRSFVKKVYGDKEAQWNLF